MLHNVALPATLLRTPLFHLLTNFLNSFLDSSDERSLKNVPLYQIPKCPWHVRREGRPTRGEGGGHGERERVSRPWARVMENHV